MLNDPQLTSKAERIMAKLKQGPSDASAEQIAQQLVQSCDDIEEVRAVLRFALDEHEAEFFIADYVRPWQLGHCD